MKLAKDYDEGFFNPFQLESSSTARERRRNCRQRLELSIFCQKVGSQDGRLLSGSTVNVSPGGALIAMPGATLRDGELVSVEMAMPSRRGRRGRGCFSGYARVVRIDDTARSTDNRNHIALEFCESSRLGF